MMGLGHVDNSPAERPRRELLGHGQLVDQLMFPALKPRFRTATSTCSTTATNAASTSCTATVRAPAAARSVATATSSSEAIDWSEVEVYKPVDDFG